MTKVLLSRAERSAPAADLRSAFQMAMTFSPSRADELALNREDLTKVANEEVSFSRVSVDENGITSALRLRVQEPARGLVAQWRQARGAFDRALEPHDKEIAEALGVKARIAAFAAERDDKLAQAERKLEHKPGYDTTKSQHERSQTLLAKLRGNHGDREANMMAFNPLYWVAILGIGVAEWMINYQVFYMFMRVPAIAAGATLIMGVLLAFAAHGHGSLLKQWSYRFGDDRGARERFGDWRMLALSTLSLALVLAAAGGSRYEVVLRLSAELGNGNLGGVSVDANPLRDVLLSLLANIAAWAVGVFIAYMAHDVDPDYMSATRQARKWEREWHKLRKNADGEKQTIEAQFERRVKELKTSSESKTAAVKPQLELLRQVEDQEEAVMASIAKVLETTARGYQSVLGRLVVSHRGETKLLRNGIEITPNEFQAHAVSISAADIRNMAR